MVHFWLRHEVKPHERRTLFIPSVAKRLVDEGHKVSVEKSDMRCFPDDEYTKVGCTLVDTESWPDAPLDAVICGLKELPEGTSALAHRHIFFAHCFKGQNGWAELLKRFIDGKGTIYDLEFLVNENGRRVAAFGWSAGYVGAYTGLLTWCTQQLKPGASYPLPPLEWFSSNEKLENEINRMLAQVKKEKGTSPSIMIIGALGRCGQGAVSLLKACGLKATEWDMQETAPGGPFQQITEHNIFINCIALQQKTPYFLTLPMVKSPTSQLAVVVDVSCDYTNPNNPIPIYSSATTFNSPTVRIFEGEGGKVVDVVSIDHLPSLVPLSSSVEFSSAMEEHLVAFPDTDVWARAKALFDTRSGEAKLKLGL